MKLKYGRFLVQWCRCEPGSISALMLATFISQGTVAAGSGDGEWHVGIAETTCWPAKVVLVVLLTAIDGVD